MGMNYQKHQVPTYLEQFLESVYMNDNWTIYNDWTSLHFSYQWEYMIKDII